MTRKLIASGEAGPAGKQIKKPCSDCPWRRDALPGWLGGHTANNFLLAAHGEDRIDCHVHGDVQCAGAAIYRANMCKSPRDRSLLTLRSNPRDVFASPSQFRDHHARPQLTGKEKGR